jgi:hypothetical protein
MWIGAMQPQGRQQLACLPCDLLKIGMRRIFGECEPTLIGIWLGPVPDSPSGATFTAHVEIEPVVPFDRVGRSRTVDRPRDRAPTGSKGWHET